MSIGGGSVDQIALCSFELIEDLEDDCADFIDYHVGSPNMVFVPNFEQILMFVGTL